MWWNTLGYAHRMWQEIRSQSQKDQRKFKALVMHRHRGHGPIVWPPHLAQEIPTFARWLDHVRTQMANGVVVDPNMVAYSTHHQHWPIHTPVCGHIETITS